MPKKEVKSKKEIETLDNIIDHQRDYLFTYAGLRQVVDKYLYRTEALDKFTKHLSSCTYSLQ